MDICAYADAGSAPLFAAGRLGHAVENIQVRVGAPRPIRAADFDGDQVSYKRDLGAYISERDMQQLYVKSIETEDIGNADGIPFQIFYGISNNTRSFWSIANARDVMFCQTCPVNDTISAAECRAFQADATQ